MYYYSKTSRRGVAHLEGCFQLQAVAPERLGSFETLSQAHAGGYRLCRCCSPIARQYRAERAALLAFCQTRAISCFLHDGFLVVTTPYSRWRILSGEAGGLLLYHRNSFQTAQDAQSPVPGYHLQRVCKAELLGYLTYIVEHEYYRMMHPVSPRPAKKEPPRKGTKRYQKQQAREKHAARRKAISNVLSLIDSLSAKPPAQAQSPASGAF